MFGGLSRGQAMLTPSLVCAYWMRGSMVGILYASELSLSRCHLPAGGGCLSAPAKISPMTKCGGAAANCTNQLVNWPRAAISVNGVGHTSAAGVLSDPSLLEAASGPVSLAKEDTR